MTINNLQLTESARLQNLKPTVDWLIEHEARQIFIAGHVGRPVNFDSQLSTRHLEAVLESVFKRSVTYKKDLNLADGTLSSMAQIILLENLRFFVGEEKNDQDFAHQLAGIADVYVNDAFATCHRQHASIVGVPALLPHAAGLHLQKEVETLSRLLENPARPMVAVVGGVKIDTKIGVIENLAKAADTVVVGGMIAKEIQNHNEKVKIAKLTADGKDIDEGSISQFVDVIRGAKTIAWNGPMGYFEGGNEQGTMAIAQAIIDSGAYSVIGGGETTEFLGSKGLLGKFSFVSTGGGAMLEFLAGRQLPGLEALG